MMDLNKREYKGVLDLIQFCLRATGTEPQLSRFITGLSELVPLDSAIAGLVTTRQGRIETVHRYFSYGRNEWVTPYVHHHLVRVDPIARRAVQDPKAFVWRNAQESHPCKDKTYLALKRSYGIKNGIAHAVQTPRYEGVTTLVSLAIPEKKIASRYLTVLEHILPHLHESWAKSSLKEKDLTPCPALTARELEILKWVKEGKSSWDISRLLFISERTVKFHLTNAFCKLDVSNRVQAVARALKLDILGM